jgi:hypothetical protein
VALPRLEALDGLDVVGDDVGLGVDHDGETGAVPGVENRGRLRSAAHDPHPG